MSLLLMDESVMHFLIVNEIDRLLKILNCLGDVAGIHSIDAPVVVTQGLVTAGDE